MHTKQPESNSYKRPQSRIGGPPEDILNVDVITNVASDRLGHSVILESGWSLLHPLSCPARSLHPSRPSSVRRSIGSFNSFSRPSVVCTRDISTIMESQTNTPKPQATPTFSESLFSTIMVLFNTPLVPPPSPKQEAVALTEIPLSTRQRREGRRRSTVSISPRVLLFF